MEASTRLSELYKLVAQNNQIIVLALASLSGVVISTLSNDVTLMATPQVWLRPIKSLFGLNYYTVYVPYECLYYDKFLRYIVNKFEFELVSNSIQFYLNNKVNMWQVTFKNGLIVDKWTDADGHIHDILITPSSNNNYWTFIIRSKTLSVSGIHEYVKEKMTAVVESSELTIHQPLLIHRNNDDQNRKNGKSSSSSNSNHELPPVTIEWNTSTIRTNKTLKNTIIRDDVKADLVDDIATFVQNESYYNLKGIPYKRGYLLYGPPGTGKTSLIKSIATKYGMDIYVINTENITKPEEITMLYRGFATIDAYHMVCFEDIDRCELLNTTSITVAAGIRTFLNELDGVIEGNKRITIFTANDKTVVENIKALCRPGRIDKMIEMGFCDASQLCRIYNHYTSTQEVLTELTDAQMEDAKEITPAIAINTILANPHISVADYLSSFRKAATAENNIKPISR